MLPAWMPPEAAAVGASSHSRPSRVRSHSAGTHHSPPSRRAARATDTARSIAPSVASAANSAGSSARAAASESFACIASTAPTPAWARRGPRAARAPL